MPDRKPTDLLTLTAAASVTGKSRQVIPAMVARGELRGKTVAGRLFVYRASAEAYARAQRGPSSQAA